MAEDSDIAALKQRTREVWSLGDYTQLAGRVTAGAAQPLVDACAISAGQDVLDVAAGSGNVAVLAAREGARVVACDLTPRLIEIGKQRSRAEGLEIEWVEADAEALPFRDGSFDCVVSAFGVMFAPRPDVVARELFRVVRPGGTVGMTSWTPRSFMARQSALVASYLPPPPGTPVPSEWGDPGIVSRRFAGLASSHETETRTVVWRGDSAADYLHFVQANAGPHIAAKRALSDERYKMLAAELLEIVRGYARGSGPIELPAEYLLIVARKRG